MSHILSDIANGVLTLTIDRPEKKNALTDAMYGALADALESAGKDNAVHVTVLRGAGDSFCAGNDIADFLAAASGDIGKANVFRFIRLLGSFPKPLVAGVQGRAVGIGTTMLLHCDYVVLAEDAKLSAPFAALGLVPEAASSMLLPARIGHPRAFAIMAMGEVMEAEAALKAGLANALVPNAALDQAVAKATAHIARLAPQAVQATKALMRDQAAMGAAMDAELEVFARQLRSAEAKEAFTAFMEKREPDFSGL